MAEDGTIDTLDGGGGDAGGGPEPSRHDDIASAFEQVETRESVPAGPSSTPAGPGAATTPLSPASPGDRARGPDGRFAPEDGAKPPEKTAGTPGAAARAAAAQQVPGAQQKPPGPAGAPPAQGQEPAAGAALRAPASWKPGAREHWSKLPADVQQEVVRRETETARVLQESSRARDALAHVQQAIGPYAQNIAASGSDAIGTISNFFKADNTLRHGSIAEKAQLTADIIKNYGVDLQALDNILAGAQVAPDPNEAVATKLRQEMEAKLQPVMKFFDQMQGARREAFGTIQNNASTEVQTFGQDAAHEFFEDVRGDMADIIDMMTARNQTITLQQAYDKAILMNPHVAEIVQRRAEAARVNSQAQAAQRARRAAASISGSPAPAGQPGAAGDSRRAEIEAAWDASGTG